MILQQMKRTYCLRLPKRYPMESILSEGNFYESVTAGS